MRSSREPCEQGPERAAAMADRVLLGIAQFGHRPATVVLVGQEYRVISETTASPRRPRHAATAFAVDHALQSGGGVDVCQRAYISKTTARRHLVDQLRQILLVAGPETGVSRRAHPRGAAEGFDLDPRVVGDRRSARRGGGGKG